MDQSNTAQPAITGDSVVAVDTSEPHLVLTFDDGPAPSSTEAVLRALSRAGATATFFVLHSRVKRHLRVLREVQAAGHEIGFHGVDHQRLTEKPLPRLAAELCDGRRELEDLIGRAVTWFRPPYGAQDLATWRAVVDAGLVPVFWTVMCRDWLNLTHDEYLAELRARGRAGAIVLMHDAFAGTGTPPHLDREALTGQVLYFAQNHGLSGCSLGDALSYPNAALIHQPRLQQLRSRQP